VPADLLRALFGNVTEPAKALDEKFDALIAKATGA
jgi:hypothetical protein